MVIASSVSWLEAAATRCRCDLTDRDRNEADLRARLAATIDFNVSSPVTVILPVSVVLGTVLSFLLSDPWCAAEKCCRRGTRSRSGQEAGKELDKGATFTNFIDLFHCKFSKFCLVPLIFSTDCNKKPVNFDESCFLSVPLVKLLMTLIELHW
jgi:hypothetical protein